MITDADQIQSADTRRRLFDLIERREGAQEILTILDIAREDAAAHVFESCSFVVALSDGKTVVEACYCPENIHAREDPGNPLFERHAATTS